MESAQYHVEMKNITKYFGGVCALDNVDVGIRAGEIHAIMGENGAGKSTLMKVLSGAHPRDGGEIYIDGKKVSIKNPKDGIRNGISVIYQEFALIDSLTVAENIFIDNLSDGGRLIHWKRLRAKAQACLDDLGFGDISVNKRVSELSVAHKQVVEICKSLARESSILILDEPTAVLASSEVAQLFQLLTDLRDKGVAIVYISHRLEEIFQLSDRITVMKDGCYVGTFETSAITEQELVNHMIGRVLENYFPPRDSQIGNVILRAEEITRGREVQGVSFEVRAGEVLGISGLVGSGRTETMRAIFGADRMDSGTVYMYGKPIKINSPASAIRHGIVLLPEDRKAQGVLLNLPIRSNITIKKVRDFTGAFRVIKKRKETAYIDDKVKSLAIRARSIESNVSSLSGGNQQKVAIAKILASDCKVLILDEPTRGVDVGAKIEIYKIINSLAAQGYAIIMISSEMMEIIGMCDRTLVMRNGRIVKELQKDELSEQNLINYSMGVNANG